MIVVMPPEEPHSLVAVQFDFDGEELKCRAERVFPSQDLLRVSWYTTCTTVPTGYQPILGGVVFAHEPSVASTSEYADLRPTKRGDRYTWRDSAGPDGLMLAMILPFGLSVANPRPIAVEVKKFKDRIALFWLLYPTQSMLSESVQVEWAFSPLRRDIDEEIEALNRQIFFASKRKSVADYDIALSFAGEDRTYVEQVANALRHAGVSVFYDEFEQDKLWGTNLYDHLTDVYARRARFTVMFISRSYADKRWTNFERQAAQARAYAESREYILPARFDDTELPGLLPTTAYVSLNEKSPTALAQLIVQKLVSYSSEL